MTGVPVMTVLVPANRIGSALDLDLLDAEAFTLAENARAPNTRRAYRSDWDHFGRWCTSQGFNPLPATPSTIRRYLTAHKNALSVATLARRISSIAVAHRVAGFVMDTRHPEIADVMKGLRNERGSAQRHAEALTIPRLKQVVAHLGDGLGDRRDRALLLVGTAAALRRSELVALDLADITIQAEGLRLMVRRSKTDQGGEGTVLPVNRTGRPTCPAAAFEAWVAAAGISEGAVFRAVNRHGHLGERLSGQAVALIVQRRAAAAGLDAPASYAGHSMRAGFATSAAQSGMGELRIARQTRHASLGSLRRYIRDGALFSENLAAEIGL